MLLDSFLITVRKGSCEKVMFSQLCAKKSVHRTGKVYALQAVTALSRHPRADEPLWADTSSRGRPPNMATEVGGAHPTGMHSCFHSAWRYSYSCRKTIVVYMAHKALRVTWWYWGYHWKSTEVGINLIAFSDFFYIWLHCKNLYSQVLLRNSTLLISIEVVGVLVAGYEQRCAYVDLVITVRVLCLFHNNESGYSWHVFIAETMYNLSMPNYCYWLPTVAPTDLTLRTDHTLH